MNTASFSGLMDQLQAWVALQTRFLDRNSTSSAFGSQERDDVIQRIYVINLDRQPHRWRQVSRELGRLRARCGAPLTSISRRFSAIDARHLDGLPDREVLQARYSLADQLCIEPIPMLGAEIETRTRHIVMTKQEVAVALSHIAVWKLIAASSVPYTLVLEDDIYFRRGFARSVDEAWAALMKRSVESGPVDFLYLSFKEAGKSIQSTPTSGPLRRPDRGLWQLSGYVLSQAGANKLLDRMPARGPIDLWVNLQFRELSVLMTSRSIIEQRPDVPSTNSYSVLPTLSQIGVLTRERPPIVRERALPGPVFAFGDSESGLTALAAALSMLGYRCCSDIHELPACEEARLFKRKGNRAFNAYVNIGSLGCHELAELARLYPRGRFIVTACGDGNDASASGGQQESVEYSAQGSAEGTGRQLTQWLSEQAPGRILLLPVGHRDKWQLLSTFLGCEYPAFPYPQRQDLGTRRLSRNDNSGVHAHAGRRLRFDSSPWIVPLQSWPGISLDGSGERAQSSSELTKIWSGGAPVDDDAWLLRDDTFPSNLALFRSENYSVTEDGAAQLTLREQRTSVRSFTSAAIACRRAFLYGSFAAELRPSNVAGLITGMFLHRNGPRQEIDLEFLGRDTTKVLVNVYYNPGNDGAKLEFGYRGTPILIDLGFDASKEFHRYEIEWDPRFIRWRVDGRLIHERALWNPTPVPDLPLLFNVNLWHSRSTELAGRLDVSRLPASTYIRFICLREQSASDKASSAARDDPPLSEFSMLARGGS